MNTPLVIRNRIFDDIVVGESACMERTLTQQDLELFAVLSGDIIPQHLDAEFAAASRFHGVIAHGMWGAALISAVLGTRLPGPGTVYLGQTLQFLAPVRLGDTLRISVVVTARDPASRRLTLACSCRNQHGVAAIEGAATVLAPTDRVERPSPMLPEVRLYRGGVLRPLLVRARPLGTVRMGVIAPCDEATLAGACAARAAGLIEPVLIGPRARIEAAAAAARLDLAGVAIEDVPHSLAAAARGAELAGRGALQALMQGKLSCAQLLRAVLAPSARLRTHRRLSHCYLMAAPASARPFILTDAVLNIAPTLEHKADIARNAIELARASGVAMPRVALLAAVEIVNPAMPATLHAAALCNMAKRGEFAGALLDGPLAFDTALSPAAVRIKGGASQVAGCADVLLAPNLESGAMLAAQNATLSEGGNAGIVLGAKVPIVLASGAEGRDGQLGSCALALMLASQARAAPP